MIAGRAERGTQCYINTITETTQYSINKITSILTPIKIRRTLLPYGAFTFWMWTSASIQWTWSHYENYKNPFLQLTGLGRIWWLCWGRGETSNSLRYLLLYSLLSLLWVILLWCWHWQSREMFGFLQTQAGNEETNVYSGKL